MKKLIFDSECYPNYYLAAFLNPDTNELTTFERADATKINIEKFLHILSSSLIITFNGRNYDMPLAMLAATGATNAQLKQASDQIIKEGLKPWDFYKKWKTSDPSFINHIDLFEVAPGKGSLKIYGGRLHSTTIQDLPYKPDETLSDEEIEFLKRYCVNDLRTTNDLFEYLKPQIQLRTAMSREEGIDLRSKSDAQMAEAVIRRRVYGKDKPEFANYKPGDEFSYEVPDYIDLRTEDAVKFLNAAKTGKFKLSETWYLTPPEGIDKAEITIGDKKYRTGIGGLHSCEEKQTYHSYGEREIVDRDVTSYYPSLILTLGLFPEAMGEKFSKVYGDIVKQRLAAKKAGDKVKADSLKIVVNGSFGKFGSRYSALFSPRLLIQTTITGQLALLMLIEMLDEAGAEVISANTDGVTFICERSNKHFIDAIVKEWEETTGLNTEETLYKSIHSRDVNSYIAVKNDGSTKTKGAFAIGGLAKNPVNDICIEAAIEYLTKDINPRLTIEDCKDIRKFVTVRAVKGGGKCLDEFLGKAARWYYSVLSDATINYAANGNTVARSRGANPCMTLPKELPQDIDYDWYENETWEILSDMGVSI